MRRRATLTLTVALLALAALSGVAQAARTAPALTPATPVTPGSGYVALGDSVTFGYQEPSVVPAPDYDAAATFPGYPEQLQSTLHLKVANFACPGETSGSLINPSAPTFGCEGAYRTAYPLHVHYSGSQLGAAVATSSSTRACGSSR